MEPDAPVPDDPRCRVCGRALTQNSRGDYVDCCSRIVRPPESRQEGRNAARWWIGLFERVTFRFGEIAHEIPTATWLIVGFGLAVLGLLCAGVVHRL